MRPAQTRNRPCLGWRHGRQPEPKAGRQGPRFGGMRRHWRTQGCGHELRGAPGPESRRPGPRGAPWAPCAPREGPPSPYLHQRRRVQHVHEVQVLLGAVRHVCHPQVQVAHARLQLLRDTQRLRTKDGHRCRGPRGPARAPSPRAARRGATWWGVPWVGIGALGLGTPWGPRVGEQSSRRRWPRRATEGGWAPVLQRLGAAPSPPAAPGKARSSP